MKTAAVSLAITGLFSLIGLAQTDSVQSRVYENQLKPIQQPKPLLADYPEFMAPVEEVTRYEAPVLVDEANVDLHVRAWRFTYNARGIIEMPNRLRAQNTAVIMVHPWGIDDGQGWNTPEPAGCADFCTPAKNHLAARHTREVINPFLKSLRSKVAFVMYSLPGNEDPIRKKIYRSLRGRSSEAEREQGAQELGAKLTGFRYRGEPLPATLKLSADKPVVDYFKQFSGLDAGPRFNGAGFWDLPIPVTRDIDVHQDNIVIYDAEGALSSRRESSRGDAAQEGMKIAGRCARFSLSLEGREPCLASGVLPSSAAATFPLQTLRNSTKSCPHPTRLRPRTGALR
jgi:hypothetical protein